MKVTIESVVTLKEITDDSVLDVCDLKVNESQETFVAPNAVSIAQAYFEQSAWFRAIYADDTPVGFVMLSLDYENADYYLWRFMLDARYQRFGFGRRALALVETFVKSLPDASKISTSVSTDNHGPKAFYESLGYVATGEFEEEEAVLEKTLVKTS